MGFLYARRLTISTSTSRIVMDHPLNHDISKCDVCLNKRFQGKPKCIPQSGQDECCICLEVMAEIKGPNFSNYRKARLIKIVTKTLKVLQALVDRLNSSLSE